MQAHVKLIDISPLTVAWLVTLSVGSHPIFVSFLCCATRCIALVGNLSVL